MSTFERLSHNGFEERVEAFRKCVIETSNEKSKHTFVLHAVQGKIVSIISKELSMQEWL